MAKSLDYTPESSVFRTLITSSGRFGLTEGSYAAEKISLTPLGIQIVAPRSEEEKADGIKKALFSVKLYNDFFTRFNGHKVPKREFLKSTLNRDFGIPNEDTDECYDMIIKTSKELGVINTIKDGEYFQLELLMPKGAGVETKRPEGGEKPQEEARVAGVPAVLETSKVLPQATVSKPKVFISHSKNLKVLSQVERLLKFGQFDYEVAVKTETTAIPIPEKIFGSMHNCNCAIINISADEQEKKEDGSYGINQNVLIEIGAAFLLYNKRVILLTDKRIALPTNLQGLYCCFYEGDDLGYDGSMKLQEALLNFRKMD